MKSLSKHINEKLLINKNFKNFKNLDNFENADEVYGISWDKLDKTFNIAKYKVKDICEINNNPVRYEITGVSTYCGFRELQFKLIEDYNILYNDGPRNFILIHPEDNERLELLLKFADYLKENYETHLDYILKTSLKIDYTKFLHTGFVYGLDPFVDYRCSMSERRIKELRKDLKNH